MLKALYVMIVGSILVGCLCFGRWQIVDGKKQERWSATFITCVASAVCFVMFVTLLFMGGDELIAFADKYMLHEGDDPAWAVIMAPFLALSFTMMAYAVLVLVSRIAYAMKRLFRH